MLLDRREGSMYMGGSCTRTSFETCPLHPHPLHLLLMVCKSFTSLQTGVARSELVRWKQVACVVVYNCRVAHQMINETIYEKAVYMATLPVKVATKI